MKIDLLKKYSLGAVIALTLSSCSEDNGTEQLFPENIDPVQVPTTSLAWTFNENETVTRSLIEGVTNPADTTVFITNLEFVDVIVDPVTGSPVLDANGQQTQIFVGPNLPNRAVTALGHNLTFDGEAFADLRNLVHPDTAATNAAERQAWLDANPDENPDDNPIRELFSQAIYTFTYSIDNGATEDVDMELVITVNGVEDPVESVSLSANALDVPVDFPVQLLAGVAPFYATYQDITWTSSDDSVATVEDGLVTGLVAGIGQTVTITATSADGLQSDSATVNVIAEPTQPVAMNIMNGENNVSAGTTFVGNQEQLQLTAAFIPADLFDDDYTVTWESSNPESVWVDQTGKVSGLVFEESAVITATISEIPSISQSVTVNVVQPQNLFVTVNANFETGSFLPWQVYWRTVALVDNGVASVEVGDGYGRPDEVFGNHGVKITSDGSDQTGMTLGSAAGPADRPPTSIMGENNGTWYEISVDARIAGTDPNNDNEQQWINLWWLAGGAGSWPSRIQSGFTASEQWQTHTLVFQDRDWSTFVNPGFHIFHGGGNGPVEFYVDNIVVKEVPAPAP